nr:unnamed protein product [Callosobruchus analis]
MAKGIKKLASDFMKNPIQLKIGSMNLSASHNILQNVDICQEHEKERKASFVVFFNKILICFTFLY